MRLLASFLLFAALVVGISGSTLAQESAATPFADLGLPELAITVTATGYEGIPAELAAGRYLVTITIGEDLAESGGGMAFVQAPPDMSSDEFMTAYMSSEEETGAPDFLFTAKYAGGIFTFGGQAHVVLDLTPGEWIAWPDDSEEPQVPVVFQVTGEMPTDLAEPASSATITMGEYLISVTEGTLVAGPQLIRIDNVGAQPHFIGWFGAPDGTTKEQFQVALDEDMQAEMTGTPDAYSGLNPDEDLSLVTFTATQSPGTSTWLMVDVPEGTQGLFCFFPDQADGIEHAYHGMYTILEVDA